jgi:hypothetical protein
MSRSVVEAFAASYPNFKQKLGGTSVQDFDGMLLEPPIPLQHRSSAGSQGGAPMRNFPKPQQMPQQRTPIGNIITEGYKSGGQSSDPKRQISSSVKNGLRKFLAILLIVFLGAFLFSSFSYTVSDTIFSKFGVQLFTSDGHPTTMVIVIHSLIFLALIYVITSVLSW